MAHTSCQASVILRLIKDLSANQKAINAVSFLDDGSFQTGNQLGQVTVRSSPTLSPVSTTRLAPCGAVEDRYNNFAYSPNFTLLAAQCGKTLVLMKVKTKEVFRTLAGVKSDHTGFFSRDERMLFIAIHFEFTFQNVVEGNKIGDYGTEKMLKFRESEMPDK